MKKAAPAVCDFYAVLVILLGLIAFSAWHHSWPAGIFFGAIMVIFLAMNFVATLIDKSSANE